jgi:uncharacterized protein (TIGR02270 family)
MVISPTAFAAGLYQEHLEEISFLYEQRISLLDDPQIKWTDIGEYEDRLEAHLDALIVGGQPAMDVCMKKTLDGDVGECYGVLRLLCRQKQTELAKAMIAGIAADDRDMARAAGDALKVEMPAEWAGEMMAFMRADPAARTPILARAFGFKRLYPPGGWADLLNHDLKSINPDLIWALGRIRKGTKRSIIQPFLGHPDVVISTDAALAMLRIGEPDTLNICLSLDKNLSWSPIVLGLGGGPQHVSRIAKLPASPEAMIAMGLLGHVGGVNLLLNTLKDSELKPFAAMALQLITGADLSETIFIPDSADEDELSPEESTRAEVGQPPYSPLGQGPGETVRRLSQDHDQWKQWWSKHHAAFRSDTKYRNGLAYSPSVLVKQLASEYSPRLIRQMVYEELVVRYDVDFAFETDMPVSKQVQAIDAYCRWEAEHVGRFIEGRWYFSGCLMA